MRIGISVSSNLEYRTGVEEYIYQLLKHLPMVDDYKNHQFFLLAPFISNEVRNITGYTPKVLKWPFKFGWTQIRLNWEMLRGKPDVLFIPAHTFPIIYPVLKYKCGVHPKLVVAIQGLEFEAVPKTYNWLKRKILRFLTKRNAKKAGKIIVPSQTTKNDLIKYYKINPDKIFVIHHGVDKPACKASRLAMAGRYILYLGSGHKRKNIEGLKKAFEILKKKYKIPHKLVLAGIEKYVSEEEKWGLLKNAEVFVYPSFYEGFGMPVLEAQKMRVPVVASNRGALPEILGPSTSLGASSALLINPENPEEIAEAIYKILSNEQLRNELIKKGQENIKRFSWLKCAEETLRVITYENCDNT